MGILKKALEQTVIDPHSDEKATPMSSDASVDLLVNEKGVSLVLSVSFVGFPLEYTFPLLPVARDPVELIEAQVRDAQDEIVYLKGLVRKLNNIVTNLPSKRHSKADTSHKSTPALILRSSTGGAIASIYTASTVDVIWNQVSYSPDPTLQLAADKTHIVVNEKGIYQVNAKVSRCEIASKFHIKLLINDKHISTSHLSSISTSSSVCPVTAHINELLQLEVGDKVSIQYPAGTLSKDAMENSFSIHKIASIA